jgi:putative salt-induced outer membrane protein
LSAPASADDKPVADGHWRGSLGAALSATSGNTSSSAVLLNGDAARLTDADKVSLGGNINYARAKIDGERTTTADKVNVFGQYDRNIDTRLFGFAKLGFDRDRVNHLSLRSALDGGLGYKLVDTPALRFTLFGGAGYASDRYDSAQTIGERTDTRFARASLFLAEESAHQLTPTVTAKQRLEWNAGVSGDNAHLLKLTAGLGVAMSSTMNLTVGLIDTYNNRPPVGQQGNDLSLFTGVNMKFDGG